MISLKKGDPRPLYEQIEEKIKELIIGGFLSEDDKIPSVRELAAELAINPNTIQKAYKELEAEGYIYARQAKGYFVKTPEKNNSRIPELIRSLSDTVHELYFLGAKKEEIVKIVEKYYNN